MSQLTHFDQTGNAIMVDISAKEKSHRVAVASGKIKMSPDAFAAVVSGSSKKGDVLGIARIAGIMGAKKTPELIPLCHLIEIEKAAVEFECQNNTVTVTCTVKTTGKTGVEMEALIGVSTALLTIYDMCKAVDKHMEICEIHVVEKLGGKSNG